MKQLLQNKLIRKLILIITICSFIMAAFCIIYIHRTNMPASQVFICDNPKHHSDFDKWLLEDCNVSWVPSYIIIQNDKVIGKIDGNIPEKTFSSKLGSALINNYAICDIPDYKITNLDGNSYTLSELTPDKDSFYILEISWANCEDCEAQDKNYTKSIYNKYSTKHIIRYYINSEQDDVKTLYN